ncbi:MAG: PaaI family thioesterase [Syntrophobacteraceae bacterium]|nr:PaaI family thioesterase [Desulfobacteraceae bacterium]
MDADKKYKLLHGRESHYCFGCSDQNPTGLRMQFYTDGESLFSDLSVPDHMSGWRNMTHGGIISAILDEVMSWSAIYLLKRFILTKSIQVEFLKPVFIGKPLRAQGKVAEVANEREARMEAALYDEDGTLCARATGTLALFVPETAVRLGIIDSADVRDLEGLFAQ